MLETLADAGDGSYQFIDSLNEAQRLFVEAFAATLHTMAKDVKIQVEFNPSRVKQYRQVGYENRQLAAEDFRNDAVDAGEAGSGQSVTALYDVDVQGDDREPLATVRIRYFDMETGAREEIERSITAADAAPAFDQASPRFRLAACVAAFAEKLRGAPWSANYEFADIAAALRPVALELGDARVQELLQLVNAADSLPQAQ
jgi:Ca-activated chloride channel family protein